MRLRASFAALLMLVAAAGGLAAEPVPFPDIDLYDFGAQSTRLSSLLGRATIVNFWATWCGPCRTELPELQRLYNDFAGRGLTVLAVNMEVPPFNDDIGAQLTRLRPRVEGYARGAGISLPLFAIDARVQAELGVTSLPTTILLDGKGNVLQYYPGYSKEGMRDLQQRLDALLKTQAKGGKGGN